MTVRDGQTALEDFAAANLRLVVSIAVRCKLVHPPGHPARCRRQELRKAARRCLDRRSRLVVARRFGLAGGRPMSLDEIGGEIGKSRETVRLILKDALKVLRQELDSAA